MSTLQLMSCILAFVCAFIAGTQPSPFTLGLAIGWTAVVWAIPAREDG